MSASAVASRARCSAITSPGPWAAVSSSSPCASRAWTTGFDGSAIASATAPVMPASSRRAWAAATSASSETASGATPSGTARVASRSVVSTDAGGGWRGVAGLVRRGLLRLIEPVVLALDGLDLAFELAVELAARVGGDGLGVGADERLLVRRRPALDDAADAGAQLLDLGAGLGPLAEGLDERPLGAGVGLGLRLGDGPARLAGLGLGAGEVGLLGGGLARAGVDGAEAGALHVGQGLGRLRHEEIDVGRLAVPTDRRVTGGALVLRERGGVGHLRHRLGDGLDGGVLGLLGGRRGRLALGRRLRQSAADDAVLLENVGRLVRHQVEVALRGPAPEPDVATVRERLRAERRGRAVRRRVVVDADVAQVDPEPSFERPLGVGAERPARAGVAGGARSRVRRGAARGGRPAGLGTGLDRLVLLDRVVRQRLAADQVGAPAREQRGRRPPDHAVGGAVGLALEGVVRRADEGPALDGAPDERGGLVVEQAGRAIWLRCPGSWRRPHSRRGPLGAVLRT